MQISAELIFVIQYHLNKFHNVPFSDFIRGDDDDDPLY